MDASLSKPTHLEIVCICTNWMGSMLRPVPLVLRKNLWRRDILQPKLRNETVSLFPQNDVFLFFTPTFQRAFTDQRNKQSGIVVQIAGSNIYRFGDSNIATPIFRDVKWTIKEGENWAVVGSGSSQKTALLQVCLNYIQTVNVDNSKSSNSRRCEAI